MVTLLDVAERAGVSKSAVSRALRGDSALSISEETRKRIFSAAEELGYQTKKHRKEGRQYQIAVIHKDTHFLNQVDNAYYFSVRYGIETACREMGMQCSFLPYSFLAQLDENLDGVIVTGNFPREQMEEILKSSRKVKRVFLGQSNFFPAEMDWIANDVQEAVDLGMDYLRSRGHRRILYLGGLDVDGTPEWERKRYYFKQYLSRHGEMEGIGMLEGEHGVASGRSLMENWLKNGGALPDAIFVSNDPLAIGALQALQEQRVEVPGNVSMVSINGDCTATATAPQLSTVDVHTEGLGREAVRALLLRLKGDVSPVRKISLYPRLLEGASVGVFGEPLS